MANFLEIIKMANFCVIKIANFFYKNVEFLLWKWRISISGFSQNGEFFALVIECLISLHWKKWTFWRNWKTFILLRYRPLSVTVMLVTSLCWWLYDGNWFQMLVAESLCWWLFSLCWWFFQWIKSVTNILNRSPTS